MKKLKARLLGGVSAKALDTSIQGGKYLAYCHRMNKAEKLKRGLLGR